MRPGTIVGKRPAPSPHAANPSGAAADIDFPQNVQSLSPDFFLSSQTTHPAKLTATRLINRHTGDFVVTQPCSPVPGPWPLPSYRFSGSSTHGGVA